MRRDQLIDDRATVGAGSMDAQLAVFTGRPAFREPVVVGRPHPVDKKRVLERIEGVLDRNWLTNHGPLVVELEAALAARLGVRHCVATSSGTSGIQLVAQALGLRGEVIVPSFTFVATAHALMAAGIKPVFCDIDPMTHCLDPAAVEAAITPLTTGILGVHLWGNAAPVVELERIAAVHGLELFFDAAHAFGSEIEGRPIGGNGRAEVFSLHATKLVNAFEGGVVATNDPLLAERVRLMANFGFHAEDAVACFGVNAKMSEASAAMALTSLESVEVNIEHNGCNAQEYREQLDGVAGVTMQFSDSGDRHNRQYVVAHVDEAACGLGRDELVALLRLENVVARRYFHPGCHRHEPYRTIDPRAGLHLPVTDAVAAGVLVLPTGRSVEQRTITRICGLVGEAVRHAPAVAKALRVADDERLPSFWRHGPHGP